MLGPVPWWTDATMIGKTRNIFCPYSGVRALEKNNSTSCLPVVPSPTFHPPAHIPICAGGCALATNPHSAPYCGIIYFHDPKLKWWQPKTNQGKITEKLCFETGVQEGHLLSPYSIFRPIIFPFAKHGNKRVLNTLFTGIGLFTSKIEANFFAL